MQLKRLHGQNSWRCFRQKKIQSLLSPVKAGAVCSALVQEISHGELRSITYRKGDASIMYYLVKQERMEHVQLMYRRGFKMHLCIGCIMNAAAPRCY